MINIDENQLKLLLEKRKQFLEKPKYSGIGEIISGISLMITLTLSDFEDLTFIRPLYFKIVAWGLTIGIFLYGGYTLLSSIMRFYSVDQLFDEIKNLDPDTKHPFNIIVIRSNQENGKYLVFKSRRWNCWLFPNYHCLRSVFDETEELQHIRDCLKRDLGIIGKPKAEYIGNNISEKFSVGDKVNKRYDFYYFRVECKGLKHGNKRSFRCNGKRYCWKTLEQMYSDKNIVKKNKDVLDYVRKTCDIS